LPVHIADGSGEYKLTMPLVGIDPRNVFILASPRSLLIEVRLKRTISHETTGGPVAECIDRRITREFTLPVEIARNGTSVQVVEKRLQITARKAQHDQQGPWSQLVCFSTQTGYKL
jgi:HSP20 family molecular chaperone IbpA